MPSSPILPCRPWSSCRMSCRDSARREMRAVRTRAVRMSCLLGFSVRPLTRLPSRRARSPCQVVGGRMKFIDIARDDNALGVLPRALADAITRIHCTRLVPHRRLRAQIGAPLAVARTGRLGERLAVCIGAGKAAEITALAQPNAGHEERHVFGPGGTLTQRQAPSGRPLPVQSLLSNSSLSPRVDVVSLTAVIVRGLHRRTEPGAQCFRRR